MKHRLVAADRLLEWLGAPPLSTEARRRLTTFADWLGSEAAPAGGIGPLEPVRVWDRHILDSLTFALEPTIGPRVLDVGSGAGLPGIPLAIAFPSWSVTLLDRSERRLDLCRRAIGVCGVDNASPLLGDVARLTGSFDRVVMRAVQRRDQAERTVGSHLASGGIGLVGITARVSDEASGGDEPSGEWDVVVIPPSILDGGSAILRIAPRDTT